MKKIISLLILSLVIGFILCGCKAQPEKFDGKITIPETFIGTWKGIRAFNSSYIVEITTSYARVRYKDYQWDYYLYDKPFKVKYENHTFSDRYEVYSVSVEYEDGGEGYVSLKYDREANVLFFNSQDQFRKQ